MSILVSSGPFSDLLSSLCALFHFDFTEQAQQSILRITIAWDRPKCFSQSAFAQTQGSLSGAYLLGLDRLSGESILLQHFLSAAALFVWCVVSSYYHQTIRCYSFFSGVMVDNMIITL